MEGGNAGSDSNCMRLQGALDRKITNMLCIRAAPRGRVVDAVVLAIQRPKSTIVVQATKSQCFIDYLMREWTEERGLFSKQDVTGHETFIWVTDMLLEKP